MYRADRVYGVYKLHRITLKLDVFAISYLAVYNVDRVYGVYRPYERPLRS